VTRIGIHTAFPLEYHGGGERFALQLAGHLTESFPNCKVSISADSDSACIARVERDALQIAPGVEYLREPFDRFGALIRASHLYRPLPRIESLVQFDANLVFLNRLPPREYLKRVESSGSRVAFLVHGIALENVLGKPLAVAAYQLYIRAAGRLTLSCLSGKPAWFQVFTEQYGKWLRSIGIDGRKIFVVPFAIDGRAFEPVRNDQVFRVIWIGRLEDFQKGVKLLVRVARQLGTLGLGDLELAVCGSGSSEQLLRAGIRNLTGVKYMGQVTDHERDSLLSTSNLMLSTANMDPFPATILQGLASGLPVVSTPASGPVEILSRREAFGVVTPASATVLTSAIRQFYTEWRNDRSQYFDRKLEIRSTFLRTFEVVTMLRSYVEMVRCMLDYA
jgi:glycosyltransferase involved in cell wall biosynthesis